MDNNHHHDVVYTELPPQSSDNSTSVDDVASVKQESSHDSIKPKARKRLRPTIGRGRVLHIWWFELLCSLSVFLALLAIVLTLGTHQGLPLSQWPYRISINSVVSVYVVVLKAAMLVVVAEGLSQLKWAWYARPQPLDDVSKFDLASRGPWGAIQLLWTLRGRHVVASIGAIVTIAALALDPVAQLLIRYYDCNVQLPDSSAIIPKKNAFSEMGLHIGAGYSTLTYEFQSAINAGLFNPESVTIPFNCPTGNCTFFEEYHTVAYCSSCTDVTKDLSRSCKSTNASHPEMISFGNGTTENTTSIYPTQHCNTSLPGGFAAISDVGSTDESITYFNMRKSQAFEDTVEMIVANLTNLRRATLVNCTTTAENATWPCHGYGAASCSLTPCIKSYRASIKENTLKEVFLSSSANWGEADISRATIDLKCLLPIERQSLINIGYSINDTTDWLAYRGPGVLGNATNTTTADLKTPNATVPDRCLYEFYEPSVMSIGYYMQSFFNGSIVSDPFGYDYVTSGPVQLQKIFDSGTVTFERINSTFANIADSMTAYMRQSTKVGNTGIAALENGSGKPATGQVYRSDTCVRVRWWYLGLPVMLVAMTVVFLIALIIQSEAAHAGNDWKSSSLALLFHGLDPNVRESQGEMARLRDMTDTAKQLRVRFRRRVTGWQFTDEN